MSTATQTKQYDRGYEDAIEGKVERGTSEYYRKGYRSGQELRFELMTLNQHDDQPL